MVPQIGKRYALDEPGEGEAKSEREARNISVPMGEQDVPVSLLGKPPWIFIVSRRKDCGTDRRFRRVREAS